MLTLSRDPNTIEWYIKRLFRIAPLYYIAIAVYHPIFVIEHARGVIGDNGLSITDILANIFFVHGWVPSAINSTVPGGWSIAVEMTFYVISPPLAGYLYNLRRTTALLVSIALCALLLICSIVLTGGSPKNNTFMHFWPVNQMPIFLIGMGLFLFSRNMVLAVDERQNYANLLMGTLPLIFGFYLGTGLDINHAIAPAWISLSIWIIIISLSLTKNILSCKSLTFIGRISFIIYIIHFFFVDLLNFFVSKVYFPQDGAGGFLWLALMLVIVFPLSAAAAAVSRRVVELPSIELGSRLIAWRRARRERQALAE